jgi:hypothetical protein
MEEMTHEESRDRTAIFRTLGIFSGGLGMLVAAVALMIWVLRPIPEPAQHAPSPEEDGDDVRQVVESMRQLAESPEFRQWMSEQPMEVVEEKVEVETIPVP